MAESRTDPSASDDAIQEAPDASDASHDDDVSLARAVAPPVSRKSPPAVPSSAETLGDHPILSLSAVDLAAEIRSGRLSAREAVEASLERIELTQPILNPFASLFAEEARAAAAAADEAYAAAKSKSSGSEGRIGPLHGTPVAFSDATPVDGRPATHGSYAVSDASATADAAMARRLKAAGAIVLGATTMSEFAQARFTRSARYGETRNPWDPSKTSGGGMGGAAAAVTTGCVALAEGLDRGGAARISAACCGCVGLKPSLGRIPMDLAPSSDGHMATFAPMTRTVSDAALFLSIVEGADSADIASQRAPTPLDRRPAGVYPSSVEGMKIALCPDLGFFAVDPSVALNLTATAEALADFGAEIVEVSTPWRPSVVASWEAWSSVHLAAAYGSLVPAHRDQMDPELLMRIEAGEAMGATAYKRIDTLRGLMWRGLSPILAACDALLTATAARPAPALEASDGDFRTVDAEGRLHGFEMTSPFSMLEQLPAISIPSGRTRDGLPTAVQIIGRPFDDPTVLRVAAAVENVRPWPIWTPDQVFETTP